jgi:hypothetical protein
MIASVLIACAIQQYAPHFLVGSQSHLPLNVPLQVLCLENLPVYAFLNMVSSTSNLQLFWNSQHGTGLHPNLHRNATLFSDSLSQSITHSHRSSLLWLS